MTIFKYVFTFLCFLIPLLTIGYKTQVLGISVLPINATDLWKVEMGVNYENVLRDKGEGLDKIYLPIPGDSASQRVRDVQIVNRGKAQIVDHKSGQLLEIPLKEANLKEKTAVVATVRLHPSDENQQKNKRVKLSAREKKEYLDLSDLSEETLDELRILSSDIFFETDRKMDRLEKAFFYIADEVLLTPDVNDLDEILSIKSGSSLGRAKLFQALARVNGVPSRIGLAVEIDSDSTSDEYHFMRTFFNEVYYGGRWLPVYVNEKSFSQVPRNVVVLSRDIDENTRLFNKRAFYSLYVQPEKFSFYDSSTYIKKLQSLNTIWADLSLHQFPLSVQGIFVGILLIPFGTILLSLCRNVIGVNTFGIFTPILLALFFLETSLAFGAFFLGLVILLGFAQRYVLSRFYLLAVPRLSIMLTLVILVYTGFAILGAQSDFVPLRNSTLSYFPIVIITVLIERFSIQFIEEGPFNTLKAMMGTVLVASLCYLLFSVKVLEMALFNHPELLLWAIGANVLIGSYKGYRLLEVTRFGLFRRPVDGV